MALIEVGLVTYLKSVSAITSLVGAGARARIYPVVLPQAPKLPALTYQVVSRVPGRCTTGITGATFVRIQIDVYASTYAEGKQLAAALRGALNGYRGALGETSAQEIFLEGERDLYEDAVRLFRVTMDAEIWITEPIA